MKPFQHRGQLIIWKDDRGFGFIKPDNGRDPDVFLHVSVLKKGSRRPQVGDVIIYHANTDQAGKVKATKAMIQGVAYPKSSSKQSPRTVSSQSGFVNVVLGCIIVGAIALVLTQFFKNNVSTQIASDVEQNPAPGQVSTSAVSVPTTLNSTTTSSPNPSDNLANTMPAAIDPDCRIKGNISVNNGQKFYHVPGMRDYDITVIDLNQGERWFCSEEDAIANGWQRAPDQSPNDTTNNE